MVDKKPNIIERLVVTCFSYGGVFGSLYGLIVFLVSSLPVGNVPLGEFFQVLFLGVFYGGVFGAISGVFLASYWALPLLCVILLVDYQQRPQLFRMASSGLIIVQAICSIYFLRWVVLLILDYLLLYEYALLVILPMTIATGVGLYALHQYIVQLDDYYQQEDPRKEKPKRKLKTAHPLALENEVGQPEMYEDTEYNQRRRKKDDGG
ncbi:MAG: hypothetical protein AAFQ07_08185 [Chloroflexota bacterium]